MKGLKVAIDQRLVCDRCKRNESEVKVSTYTIGSPVGDWTVDLCDEDATALLAIAGLGVVHNEPNPGRADLEAQAALMRMAQEPPA